MARAMRDRVNETNGLYAMHKLALALIATTRLQRGPEERDKMRDRLLTMQRQDGDFDTDYDVKGTPVGQVHVETTSLAILAPDGEAGSVR